MKMKRRLVKRLGTLVMGLFAVVISTLSHAQESVQDGLQRCSLISDTSARLVCYEQLSGRQHITAAKVVESPAIPPDELGSESLSGRNSKRANAQPVNVRVIKCSNSGRKNAYNTKFIFYLEGGQVWKQISDKRLHFKDCNFSASIVKDYFGYKMQLDDSKKKFRISRIR